MALVITMVIWGTDNVDINNDDDNILELVDYIDGGGDLLLMIMMMMKQ